MEKKSTSDRLKEIMSMRNLRQVDILEKAKPFFTKKTKLTRSDLSQYVSGVVIPGQDKLTLLGLALNVNEAWLLGFNVPMSRSSMPQSQDSPVLKAIYSSEYRNSDLAHAFVAEKLSDYTSFASIDYTLLTEFNKLNNDGKKEAINRIKELTFVPKYTK